MDGLPYVSVGNRIVGPGHPVFVVAEIGQNHNGDLDMALRLIDAAVYAGADAVKFQKRTPSLAVPNDQKEVMRETPWGSMTYLAYRERLEFGAREYSLIAEYCARVGIQWFASAWDIESVLFLGGVMDVPAIKIASATLTRHNVLRMAADCNIPIILSTGMSTPDEIDVAVDILGNSLAILCHCNSTYPCPPEDLNLRCILSLQSRYPSVVVGYSGHEVGLPTTIAAVALGACYIERHITLDRSMWGTDQAASVEPLGFQRLVSHIRSIESALGDGIKRVTPGEIPVMQKLRKVVNASNHP